MTNNTKVFLVVVGLCAIGYFMYRKITVTSTGNEVSWLVSNNYTTGTPTDLQSLGADYIHAWYEAAKNGQTTFVLSGKTYNTKGGTAL